MNVSTERHADQSPTRADLLSQEQVVEAMDFTTRMLIGVIASNLRNGVWNRDPSTEREMRTLVERLSAEVQARRERRTQRR